MMDFKIGVIIDSFRTGVREGVIKAKKVGASGIQLYATSGEMAPENMSPGKIREFIDLVKSNGLEIAAVCGDLGGHGFSDPEENIERVERSKRIMDLAAELGSNIVTTHIGVIPEDDSNPRWRVLADACEALGTYADSVGSYFAIETGPERAVILKKFLDSLDSKGVRVNMDPANFVMVTGDDPAIAVSVLSEYIVHTHAKDGIMLCKKDPEVIYGLLEDELKNQQAFKEVPLGTGGVDFPKYLRALEASGYNGYLTIEREVGDDPYNDILQAVEFLKKVMGGS
jgi:L-ribulose-5-phosphate 3-epimerase